MVAINNACSHPMFVAYGVPQVSILGPVLFLMQSGCIGAKGAFWPGSTARKGFFAHSLSKKFFCYLLQEWNATAAFSAQDIWTSNKLDRNQGVGSKARQGPRFRCPTQKNLSHKRVPQWTTARNKIWNMWVIGRHRCSRLAFRIFYDPVTTTNCAGIFWGKMILCNIKKCPKLNFLHMLKLQLLFSTICFQPF